MGEDGGGVERQGFAGVGFARDGGAVAAQGDQIGGAAADYQLARDLSGGIGGGE